MNSKDFLKKYQDFSKLNKNHYKGNKVELHKKLNEFINTIKLPHDYKYIGFLRSETNNKEVIKELEEKMIVKVEKIKESKGSFDKRRIETYLTREMLYSTFIDQHIFDFKHDNQIIYPIYYELPLSTPKVSNKNETLSFGKIDLVCISKRSEDDDYNIYLVEAKDIWNTDDKVLRAVTEILAYEKIVSYVGDGKRCLDIELKEYLRDSDNFPNNDFFNELRSREKDSYKFHIKKVVMMSKSMLEYDEDAKIVIDYMKHYDEDFLFYAIEEGDCRETNVSNILEKKYFYKKNKKISINLYSNGIK